MGWVGKLRRDGTPEERAQIIGRIACVMLAAFGVGFAAGAAQVYRALHSGQAWSNYRGELITHSDMMHTFILLLVAATLCILLALRWWRVVRRGR
jgi:phosphate/sulfate permease